MRLRLSQRERLVQIFEQNKKDLLSKRNKWENLRKLCENENIIITAQSIGKIIKEYLKTGSFLPKQSKTRAISKTKITPEQIREINNLVYNNEGITSDEIKNKLNLNVSPRTIRRHIKFLGWKKLKIR